MKKVFLFTALSVIILTAGAGCSSVSEPVSLQTRPVVSTPVTTSSVSQQPTETVCTEEYKPVCGLVNSKKQDFGNRCYATKAGALAITEGKCQTAPSTTTTPTVLRDPKITNPQENSVINSPVTITGEVSGVWFFEGQFPVIITDKNEKELGKGIVTAQGDWRTEKSVKFSGTISFTNPDAAQSGFIIFKKDNPSGDPKNDLRYRISVLFSQDEKICTKEYKPVCGEVEVQCIKAPCPPLKQTYSNRCEALKAQARNIVEGSCEKDQAANTTTNYLQVTSPSAGQKITTPLMVKGSVLSPWLSENSAPVEIVDKNGVRLGSGTIKGSKDWMTHQGFMPFESQIEFKKGSAVEGFVIFKKDNPSGDPARDQSVKIPVKF